MSINEIMKIPYIMFVLGMADAPSIDYETKKEEEQILNGAQEQANALKSFLG